MKGEETTTDADEGFVDKFHNKFNNIIKVGDSIYKYENLYSYIRNDGI